MIKKLKKNKFFSEKGSVTLFILISIIFFLIISLNVYSSNKNKIIAQKEEIQAIAENYNKDLDNMDEIYENLVEVDLKTVFIKESSINTSNKIYYNLSEWTNENVVANVTVNSGNDTDTQLQVKVISKRTGTTIIYNQNQINNNEVIITENSTVVVIFGNKQQKFELNKFDKEIPVLSYESFYNKNDVKHISGRWTNKETYTKLSVKEEISGISEMYYSTDKQNWTKLNFAKSNGIYEELNTYCGKEIWTIKDGRIEDIYFRAKDGAGNYSNISNVYQLRYDLTAPTKPIIENEYNDIWTNKDVEIIAKSSDSLSKIAKIEYSYDEIDWKSDWKEALQNNGDEASISGKWNNSFNGKIYVRAIDNAENISETSYAILKQDIIPPIVELEKNGGTYNIAQNQSFVPITTKITAQDNGGSGLNNLQYQISSSTTLPTDDDSNWKTFTNESTVTENKTGGTWYLYTKVTDKAGNRATHIQKSNPYVVNYSVAYDANGGTGTMPTDSVLYNTPYITRENTFTREGYTFKGWNEKADGTGSDWTNWIGKPWTWTYNKSITLYAQWTPNQYTLTVNPNGGIYNDTTTNSTFTQNYGSTKTISNPTAPAGYKVTFNGNGGSTPSVQTSTKSFTSWSNSGAGSLSGTIYTFGAGNGTLTANYQNNSIILPTSTRTGYTFAGWYDAASGGNKIGDAGAAYTPTGAKTLYAHWTAKKITVTFKRNTSATDNTSTTQTFTYGVAGQSFSAKGWSKTNYKLLGWNRNRTATTAQYSTLSGVSDSWIDTNSPSVTIYAIWAPDPRITITDQPDNQTVVAGNKYRFSISTDNGRSWICKI